MDLDYLYFLQCLREQLPDWVTSALNIFADVWVGPVVIIVAIVMLWDLDPRQGRIMVVSIFGAMGINSLLKDIACVYRPWLRDSRLYIFPDAAPLATGYSFPSMHSTLAGSFASSFGYYLKQRKNWLWIPCVLIALLVPLIRNWVGAHTPQDVIVGFLTGLICTTLAIMLIDWVEKGENRDIGFAVACAVVTIASLAFIALKSYPMDYLPDGSLIADPVRMMTDGFRSFGALLGFSLGWVIERRFAPLEKPTGKKNFILRIVACVVLVVVVFVGVAFLIPDSIDRNAEQFIIFFLLLFTAEGLAPLAFKKFKI